MAPMRPFGRPRRVRKASWRVEVALAGEGEEAFVATVRALEAGEAGGEVAATEEGLDGGNGGGVERAEGYVGPPWEEVLKLMAEDAQKF